MVKSLGARLWTSWTSSEREFCDDVCQQIELIQGVPGLVRQPGHNVAGVDANCGRGTLYTYNGRLWDVPQTFAFYDFCETGCWVEVVAARDASLHDSG